MEIVLEPVNGGPTGARLSVGVAQGVWKAFGETQALRDVSLDVGDGECHGLVGRNGAGKSTLVAIFTGLIRPDRGVVRLGAEAAPSLADRAAWQRLVACVYQKSMVVPSLTVAENIFLNRATGDDHGIVNWRAMRSRARQVMFDWGFDLDVSRLARDLTVEQRQVVEIARALSVGARFLILDEPTASLEKAAIERLFERIRRLKGSGVGILYISHHLEEIYEVCDRVTVLRDGERVLSTPVGETKQDRLVEAMVGVAQQRATEIAAPLRVIASDRPRLESLCYPDWTMFRDRLLQDRRPQHVVIGKHTLPCRIAAQPQRSVCEVAENLPVGAEDRILIPIPGRGRRGGSSPTCAPLWPTRLRNPGIETARDRRLNSVRAFISSKIGCGIP